MAVTRLRTLWLLAGAGSVAAYACSVPDLPDTADGGSQGSQSGTLESGAVEGMDATVSGGDAEPQAMDAGATDSGTMGVGTADAGTTEAGTTEAAATEAGAPNSGADALAPPADGSACATACVANQTQCGSAGLETCTAQAGACPAWISAACITGATCQSGACVCPVATPDHCSTCVKFASDTNNCGKCSHGCAGGQCVGGACQSVTLATGQTDVNGLAVNSKAVYWVYQGTNSPLVTSCAIGGCSNTPTLLSNVIWAQGNHPIAVDETNIYYNSLDYDGILKCPLAGCTSPVSIGSSADPGIAIDPVPGNVYWPNSVLGGIYKWSSAGGSVDAVPAPQGHRYTAPLAADGTYVYAVDDIGGAVDVVQCAANVNTGCIVLGSQYFDGSVPTVSSIATDGKNVYWSLNGAVWTCAVGGCAAPTLLASARIGSLDIAADGTNVYWTESTSIVRCAATSCGGSPTPVLSGLSYPQFLVADKTSLYWNGRDDATIMKVAKP